MDLRSFVREIPDFPRDGILYRDITPLLLDAKALDVAVSALADRVRPTPVDLHRGRRGTSLRSAVVSCASCCRGQRVSRTAPAPGNGP